ncbi:hypothetical protein ZWY2020_052099 [Hordeum vulgare]|nr:hypothetical protein ZWY2020_052099 [Hordeum vulgare]
MGLLDGLLSGRRHDGVRMGDAASSSSSSAAAAMATDDAGSASASAQQCSDGIPPLSPTGAAGRRRRGRAHLHDRAGRDDGSAEQVGVRAARASGPHNPAAAAARAGTGGCATAGRA